MEIEQGGGEEERIVKFKLLQVANRAVLIWGYISLVVLAAGAGWFLGIWQSFRSRPSDLPSFIHIDDLAGTAGYGAFTNMVAELRIRFPDFDDGTSLACYVFKNRFAERRTEEWRKLEAFLKAHRADIKEEDIRLLLGEPDLVEPHKRVLRYALVDFNVGGNYVTVEIEDGKVANTSEGAWIQ